MTIEVNELTYSYPGGKRLEFGSFKVDQGQHTLLLGESGSGKTTLLHLLGGLLRGFDGHVRLADTILSDLSDSALDKFRGQSIGFVFQNLHLLRSLNVQQNLDVATWLSGAVPERERIRAVLDRLNLGEKMDAAISRLSHGQAQRVAIARAIVNRPSLILADEPTSALDDKHCLEVMNLLMSAASESNATLLIATHDQRLKSAISNTIRIGV